MRFSPRLSERKREAITRLGMGTENKVVLRWAVRDIFWPAARPYLQARPPPPPTLLRPLAYCMHAASSTTHLHVCYVHLAYCLQCTDQRFRFLNLHHFGKPGVLLVMCAPLLATTMSMELHPCITPPPPPHHATLHPLTTLPPLTRCAPPFSTTMERMDDAAVLAELLPLLRATFAPALPMLPPPLEAHITRWGADPYCFGSYSFDRVGSSAVHRAALRAPEPEPGCPELGARLFFAGEACSVDAAQCVHGAFETGEDAAGEVLRSVTIACNGGVKVRPAAPTRAPACLTSHSHS